MEATNLERDLRGRLQPFQTLDRRWIDEATVIAVGTMQRGTYPCIFHEDGSRDMPLAHVLRVVEVLRRGPLRRETIDLSPPFEPRLEFPGSLKNGRRYLLFLRPGEEAARLLASPDEPFTVWSQLGAEDIVALVDLDQTRSEAEELKRRVEAWRRREAFVLDAGQ